MNVWSLVRVGLVLFVAVSNLFVPLEPQAKPPTSWLALAVIFVFCPLGLLFVFAIQAINPWSSKVWRRPSWSLNPFNFREPLQFFHLAAYVCLAQGVVTVARVAYSSTPFYVEALLPLMMGLGTLAGVNIALVVFRSKVERAGA